MNDLDGPSQEILEDVTAAVQRFQSELKVLKAKPDEVYAKLAYLCFFVRASRLFRVFRQSVELGYGPEAELLLRPFFETVADWLYVAKAPTQLGERYLRYESAADLKRLRVTGQNEAAARFVEVKGDAVQVFCDTYHIESGKLPDNWSGYSFEAKVGKAGLENYYSISRFQSALIHNCPSRIDEYVTVCDEGLIQLKTEPDFGNMRKIISLVCLALGPCLSVLDESFQMELSSLLNEVGGKVRLYAGIPADV